MHRLDNDDLERIEQALAQISGIAPRGWIVTDGPLVQIGNVRANGVVGHGLSCFPTAQHAQDLDIAVAITTILNDAGRLLLEVRRQREAAAPAD